MKTTYLHDWTTRVPRKPNKQSRKGRVSFQEKLRPTDYFPRNKIFASESKWSDIKHIINYPDHL